MVELTLLCWTATLAPDLGSPLSLSTVFQYFCMGYASPMRWFFLVIFLSTSAQAEEWKPADYALLGGAMTLLVVDWGQTRDMTRHPNYIGRCPQCGSPYYEHNPILGKSPSIGDVDKYFALAILGTA